MPKPGLDKPVHLAAESEGLRAELISAIIVEESAAHPCALSPKGAQRLMPTMLDREAWRADGIPRIPETVSYVSDILNRFRIQ